MSIRKLYLTKEIVLEQYKNGGYDGLTNHLFKMDAIIHTDEFTKWVIGIILLSNESEKIKRFKLSKIFLL